MSHLKACLLIVALFSFLATPTPIKASILYTDDFDSSESINNWVKKDTYGVASQSYFPNWKIENGYFKAITNGVYNQNNQQILKYWDYTNNNHVVSFDLLKIRGDNVNFIFNYGIAPHEGWFYEVHLTGSEAKLKKSDHIWGNGSIYYTYPYYIENNVIYNVIISLFQNDIKIFIKKNVDVNYVTLFDVVDSGIKWTGNVGLRAGTGLTDPYLEIWFDNFKVESLDAEPTNSPTATPTQIPTQTPTPTLEPTQIPTSTSTPSPSPTATPTPTQTLTPTQTPSPTPTNTLAPTNTPLPTPTESSNLPLILIPGLGGSISTNLLTNNLGQGEWQLTPGSGVYNNLINMYKNNNDFYQFYYDWRQTISDSAGDLYDYIRNVVKPSGEVNIIGHSLGGLVARACLQEMTSDHCFINELVTVGSPHYGAIDTYPLIEGGEIWRNGVSRLALEILITYHRQLGETKRDTIQRIAPVIKDLLPTFDYLKENGFTKPYSALRSPAINYYLPTLNSNYSRMIDRGNTVYGYGVDTVEQLYVSKPNRMETLLGLWQNGKVISQEVGTNGDRTVLTKSASINNLVNATGFNLDHGQLISDKSSLESILDLLNTSSDTSNTVTNNETNDYLVLMVHSPIVLSLLNPPEDVFVSDELIIIPQPGNTEYQINLHGISSDNFTLDVGQIGQKGAFWSHYYGQAQTGSDKILAFQYHPPELWANPLIDQNNNHFTEQLEYLINLINNNINITKINTKIKAKLEKQLEGLLDKNTDTAFIGRINLYAIQVIHLYNQKQISPTEFMLLYDQIQSLYNVILQKTTDDQRPLQYLSDISLNLAEKEFNRAANYNITISGARTAYYADERLKEALLANNSPYFRFWQSQIALDTLQQSRMIKY